MQAICDSCAHQQKVPNTRGSVFTLCRRSREEPERFAKYPRMPLLSCVGFTAVGSSTVSALSVTAVKGTRLRRVGELQLTESGAAGDRRFFVIDERGRMQNGKQLGSLQELVTGVEGAELTVEFPDGRVVRDAIRTGEEVTARFYSRELAGRLVEGPWSAAISQFTGRQLRIVEAVSAVDRGLAGAVSLVSQASLSRLAEEAGVETLDARRFRMTIEINGVEAHAEDAFLGQEFQIGEAVVRFEGNIGRCLVTGRDPDSGEPTLPTLDLLRAYRSEVDSTEPLPFGIYGRVVKPGAVRLGDRVAPAADD